MDVQVRDGFTRIFAVVNDQAEAFAAIFDTELISYFSGR